MGKITQWFTTVSCMLIMKRGITKYNQVANRKEQKNGYSVVVTIYQANFLKYFYNFNHVVFLYLFELFSIG